MHARRRAYCFFCAVTLAALALAARSMAQTASSASTAAQPAAAQDAAPSEAAPLGAPVGPPQIERLVNPTRLLVKPRRSASREEIAAAHARVGATVVSDLPQIGWQVVSVPYGANDSMRAAYAKEAAIERADLDHGRRLAYVPNDPYWPYHWHLQNIAADAAWDTVKGDPSVVIAVMDTGLSTTHPDLT